MDESESKNEKQNERRFDPELLKKGLRCDLDQYEMLKRCSENKNMTEWNEWRKKKPKEEIWLEGADFKGAIFSVNLNITSMVHFIDNLVDECFKGIGEDVRRIFARRENIMETVKTYLEGADFRNSHLKRADFLEAHLEAANFTYANLESANFRRAVVDGSTVIWQCKVNRHREGKEWGTDFNGVGLDRLRIDPETKQLLEYNIRRMNWDGWYKKGCWWQRILKRLFIWLFWLISDYGLRTWRIIVTFFVLAITFAVVYWLCPTFVMVNQVVGDIRGFWHALYFSVVTMTTLGFGDIAANPDSWGGQTLLMLQVILGYVLLGALVTRFAVLFTAGGPAGKFADEKKKRNKTTEKIKN